MGQRGRCLNVRLLEHRQKTEKVRDGFLAQHCSDCGCTPIFGGTTVIAKASSEQKKLIIEAAAIEEKKKGDY